MILTTYVITNVWYAYGLFALAMIMVALRMSPLQSLMTALVRDSRRGMLMSLAIATGQLGMSLGTGVAGSLYTRMGYVSNTTVGAVAILAMAVLVSRYLPEPSGDVQPAVAQ